MTKEIRIIKEDGKPDRVEVIKHDNEHSLSFKPRVKPGINNKRFIKKVR